MMENIRPAATLILIRGHEKNCEVLLLKRNPDLAYLGGAWVFPGGSVDDRDRDGNRTPEDAAVWAAVRETREECGLSLSPDALVLFSHWLTPHGMPRRYATHFFMAAAPLDSVSVDGSEITDFRWLTPSQALEAQARGAMLLPPPVFVTLTHLTRVPCTSGHFKRLSTQAPAYYNPKLFPAPGGLCSVYEDDSAFGDGNLSKPGRRHRLWMVETGWVYENSA